MCPSSHGRRVLRSVRGSRHDNLQLHYSMSAPVEYSVTVPLTIMMGAGGPVVTYGTAIVNAPVGGISCPASGDVVVHYLVFNRGDTIAISYEINDSPGWVFAPTHSLRQTSKKSGQPNDNNGDWNFPPQRRGLQSSGKRFVLVDCPATWASWKFSYSLRYRGTEFPIDPEITNSDEPMLYRWKGWKAKSRRSS